MSVTKALLSSLILCHLAYVSPQIVQPRPPTLPTRPVAAEATVPIPTSPPAGQPLSRRPPSFLPAPSATATVAAEPELTPFDFYTAPCPSMMSEFSRAWATCETKKTAATEAELELTQASANNLLYAQAVCLCSYTYSAIKPHVQVLLGRCHNWVPSQEEFDSIHKRVTQCTDTDYAGLAMSAGLSTRLGGEVSESLRTSPVVS